MLRQQQKDRKQDYRRWKDKNPRNVSGLEAHESELASTRKSPKEDYAKKNPLAEYKLGNIFYYVLNLFPTPSCILLRKGLP